MEVNVGGTDVKAMQPLTFTSLPVPRVAQPCLSPYCIGHLCRKAGLGTKAAPPKAPGEDSINITDPVTQASSFLVLLHAMYTVGRMSFP